jgi:ribosomal protein S18 acetylase RimI-like enzyme
VNTEPLEIRSYQSADREDVVGLWQDCGLVRPNNDSIKDIARKLKVRADLFLVGLHEGKIVASAMVGFEGHRGWINYFAVSPLHQKKGYGRRMMEEAEKRLRAEGCPKINIQVRSSNTEALKFYSAIGFTKDEVFSLGKRLEHDEKPDP